MFNFLNINPPAFGLDIADMVIRIVQLKKKRGILRLISWGEKEIPPDLMENEEIKDEKRFAELLKQSVKNIKGKKIKTKNAIVSLPEEKAFVTIIQVPITKKDELQATIIPQAENYIPLPLSEVYFDFQIVPSNSKTTDSCDILLVAFPKKNIDQYVRVLKEANIIPVAFETESQAITRVLSKNNDKSFFVINFGESHTIFAIFSNQSLRFSSSIAVSFKDIIKAISQALNITPEKVEKLKYDLNTSKTRKKEKIFNAVEPVLNNLCDQVKKYINYYRTYGYPEYPDSKSKKTEEEAILCGKGANLNGLSDFFSATLGIPVRLARPWPNLVKKKSIPLLPNENDSLKYITALGLALRGVEKNND